MVLVQVGSEAEVAQNTSGMLSKSILSALKLDYNKLSVSQPTFKRSAKRALLLNDKPSQNSSQRHGSMAVSQVSLTARQGSGAHRCSTFPPAQGCCCSRPVLPTSACTEQVCAHPEDADSGA